MLTPRQQLEALGVRIEDMEAQSPEESAPRFTDVPSGPEMHRILNLPRRAIPSQTSQESIELAALLTQRLAKVANPYPGPAKPIQALALREAFLTRGLVAPIKVGGGKMLTAFLMPVVLAAKRPLYVCPALMVPDTAGEFHKYTQSWTSAPSYPIVSYQTLASPKSGESLGEGGVVLRASLLERMAPDLIVLDEAHACGNSTATTTKRVKAYHKAHPDTVIVVLTGTLFSTSIKQGSHLMKWALGDAAPLPHDFIEREAWASYLDAKAGIGPRVGVGALLDLLTTEEKKAFLREDEFEDQRAIVRGAVARRILETPGVIGTQDPPLDVALTIDGYVPEHRDEAINDAFEELRATWCLPDGTELVDGLEFARHANTLGHGEWKRWDPRPPEEWIDARNTWAKWCRRAIKSNRRNIDSEALMKAAVRKGIYDDEGALERWETTRDAERARTKLREPPSVSVWVSDEAIRAAGAWMNEHQGLVWARSIGLGERLARDLQLPYYGAKGVDAAGRHITKHPGGPAIASMAANGTGRNLQKIWSTNLWMCAPNEQSLGRTHRPGQTEDVRNWIYLGCAEHLSQFWAASNNKARFANEILNSLQKLRYATIVLPTARELEALGGPRWTNKPA